jgi:MoaE-MoaD fusion protein
VAVLPPVAGGAVGLLVGVRRPPLPIDEVLATVASPAAGATVLFLGTVRDHSSHSPQVERLEYRAYEEMAERVLHAIAAELHVDWPQLTGIALLHAVGDLPVGAHTIAVACSSAHREEAYAASRHALEEVKRRVPIWKREVGPDGSHWVGLDHHPY